MREPIPLENVYTAVKLLDSYSIREYSTPEELEQLFRENNRRLFYLEIEPKLGGLAVANRKQYLAVVGGPGAGKSTFLRKVGLEALRGKDGQFEHELLPVFLELKRFNSDEIEIESSIVEEFRTCGLPHPEEFVAAALAQGQLLVLLDGLDEVPSRNLNQVVEKIQDFADRYSNNRFISSCRTAAYRNCGGLKQFIDIAIAEFDGGQIKQFVRNWFRSDSDREAGTADTFLELLERQENQSAKELARTPLLLTFLCLVYDYSQNLMTNRAALYGKALDILLEEWAAEKRDKIYEGFHPRLEKVLLSEIAYQSFEEDRLFFSEESTIAQITEFLAETLDAPKHLDGKQVLDAIEVQQGILVERVEGVYSFSHLTLQEYLTARYIAQEPERIDAMVKEHLTDARWKEVFLLVAGLLDRGDCLLTSMLERTAVLSSPAAANTLAIAFQLPRPQTRSHLQHLRRSHPGKAVAEKRVGFEAIALPEKQAIARQ